MMPNKLWQQHSAVLQKSKPSIIAAPHLRSHGHRELTVLPRPLNWLWKAVSPSIPTKSTRVKLV